jgi:L-aspartate oxidase
VQFHPTALRLAGQAPFLISEAVRGEGAYLIDGAGRRFVDELAPRDVVARAIYERLAAGADVALDLRHLAGHQIQQRFPHIYSFCLELGLDFTRQPLPVTPAAHYFMGGLQTDLYGRTSRAGLFAAGEAASAGVHGANRLASNSLLECVVFGRRAASAMIEDRPDGSPKAIVEALPSRVPQDVISARRAIQAIAWERAGIVRSDSGLRDGLRRLEALESQWETHDAPSVEQSETANLLTVARLILQSALIRLESRGAHFRTDYPERNDARFAAHSRVRVGKNAVIEP